MLISHSHKFIFIHVYKCAGSAMAFMLRDYGVDKPMAYHYKATQIRDLIGAGVYEPLDENPNAWNEYFKFAFVRNPFDWVVSLYHWLTTNKHHDMGDFARKVGFEGFIEFLYYPSDLQFKHGGRDIYRTPLKKWVVDENNDVIVDFIGRFEHIDRDFDKICKKLNIENRLKKTNSSVHPPYRECYTERTKAMVREIYQEDLDCFAYNF